MPGTTEKPVRPVNLFLGGDLEVGNVHWSSWGRRVATGKGTGQESFTPALSAPVSVRLSQVRVCHGQAYYNRVSIRTRVGTKVPPGHQHWAPC